MERSGMWRIAAVGVVLAALVVPSALHGGGEPSIEELKDRVAKASIADRPPLCIRISERQLGAADRLYVAGDVEKWQAALADVAAFAELARDNAIQSHKHEKQSEIAIRKMARKLADLKHTVAHEDQKQIQDTIDRLERVRDDLLAAMFRKSDKK
ncbi:MAG: hypothetical protein ABSB39_17810 [Candidatus Sulfotelmatobacter sp.]|jgi:hypothetical protein